jgi:hypothetical protein
MSKARDIANILSANTAIATDAEVTSAVSTHATAANGHIGRGTTLNRPISPSIGDTYFDTTLSALISYTTSGWIKVSSDPAPQIASISPTTAATTGTVVTITGSSFKSALAVQFIGTNSTVYNSPVATFVNATTATATTPALPVAYEPYDVKIINADNQFALLDNCLDSGGTPAWNTSSGTIATIAELSALNVSVSATDPDGTSIIYSSSNLPAWISLNSSTGALTGNAPDISSDTTYSFDITASDGVNSSSRSFNIITTAITVADVLVVAGGGGGASGGGGAGGVQTFTGTTLLKNSTYQIIVGNGGTGGTGSTSGAAATNGGNSQFGSLTASVGGGGGGRTCNAGDSGGYSGGSGGGGGGCSAGNQVGGSPTSGQGYIGGGTTSYSAAPYPSGGGGGAGGPGSGPTATSTSGNGGIGIQSSITGVSTYYGGGGGGGVYGGGTGGSGGNGGGGTGSSSSGGTGTPGTPNTGGGGGGAGSSANASSGGSGIVIIAYPNTNPNITTIPGTLTYILDTTTRAGYKVYKFTAGSGTVTF